MGEPRLSHGSGDQRPGFGRYFVTQNGDKFHQHRHGEENTPATPLAGKVWFRGALRTETPNKQTETIWSRLTCGPVFLSGRLCASRVHSPHHCRSDAQAQWVARSRDRLRPPSPPLPCRLLRRRDLVVVRPLPKIQAQPGPSQGTTRLAVGTYASHFSTPHMPHSTGSVHVKVFMCVRVKKAWSL